VDYEVGVDFLVDVEDVGVFLGFIVY